MKSLIIDPRISGMSGSMLLAALLDLTDNQECLPLLTKAVCEVTHCTASIKAVRAQSMGLKAVRMDLELNDEEFASSEDFGRAFKNIANFMEMSPPALEKGLEIIKTVTESRNAVLAQSPQAAGSIETAIEIAGILWLLDQHEYLNGNITSLPLALGDGISAIGSATMPSPSPAVLEIISRSSIPTVVSTDKAELSTITGAALAACLADEFSEVFPTCTPTKTGYGTDGSKHEKSSRILRIVDTIPSLENGVHAMLLETLVDDATGETLGHTLTSMLERGAFDAYITPATGKKNRPANLVSVLCAPGEEKNFSLLLMQCTGSIGIRCRAVDRFIADRKIEKYKVELGGEKYPVRIKISTFDGHLISRKPDFDDLSEISKQTGLSPRIIAEEVKRQCFLPIKNTHLQ